MILALSVRQPYADAFFRRFGGKDVENRTRPTAIRGRVAIHASKQLHPEGVVSLGTEGGARGAVIGTVELVDCHREGSPRCRDWGCAGNPWAEFADHRDPRTRFHYVVENPREFVTPIPAKGMLGLWTPGPSVAHLITLAEVVTG